jgi:hypothetical protein
VKCPKPRTVNRLIDGQVVAIAIACKGRRCPACGPLWAGDTRRRILANLAAYNGDVALATITAPGTADGLVDRETISTWNQTAPARWRKLHRSCSQRVHRQTGTRPTLLAWSWEYQKRGALHKHLPLGMNTPAERRAARLYMNLLEQDGPRFGFGFVSDTRRGALARAWRELGPERIPADRAGRYVAKYLSPLDAAGKPTMSETVTHSDVPPLVVYVSRALTSQTGITMRYLRHVRLCWVLKVDPRTGETLASILERGQRGDGQAGDDLVAAIARLRPS